MKKTIWLLLMLLLPACGSNNAPATTDNSMASVYKQLTRHSPVVKTATAVPTYDQQMVVVKLFQAMFNATPGTDLLTLCSGLLAGGMPESTLADLLSGTPLFQSTSLYPTSLSNLEFSRKFLGNLVGSTVSETNKTALASQLADLISSGWSRGNAMWLLVSALANVPASNPDWGAAATQLNNKLTVSYYYSATKSFNASDLSALQAVTAPVTNDPATVTTTKIAIDNHTIPADITAPAIPANIIATVSGATAISLTWTAASDNVGVTGYKVYRNGSQLSTTATTSFTDSGLSANTTYTYTVASYDGAGNTSSQSASTAATTATAAVQIGASTGTTIKPLLGVNAGPLAAGTKVNAEFTAQYKSIGVRSIRTHDLLIYSSSVPSANPALYPGPLDMSTMYFDRTKDPTLSSSYNFTLSDQHFAAIINGGFEPFFRLGDSAGLTKPPTPSERPNWERAAIEILKHYTQGQWGGYTATINEVEIWNEPDSTGFWNRSQNEFISLYVETALALRTAFPTLRIGGPGFTQGAVTSPTASGWLYSFLDQVKAANAPLDFISFHTYANDIAVPASLATALRTILDGRGFTSTKIYITEWNTYANATADITQAQAYRAGALGASTLTASWLKMQDAPVDRLFHYRGSDPNANTPEDYGLYTGSGVAKRTALAFQQWAALAGTQERLAATVTGNSNLLSIAGKDLNGRTIILVVNMANSATTWIPVNSSSQVLTGTWRLATISDNSASTQSSIPVFPVSIPAYGVQVLSAN